MYSSPSSFPKAFQCYKPVYNKVFGVIVSTSDNRILLIRGRKKNKWSFPKGHLKSNETSYRCAMRECYEETGISFEHIDYNSYRRLSSGAYFVYDNATESIPSIQDNDEVCEVRWVPVEEIASLRKNIDVSEFIRAYYQ